MRTRFETATAGRVLLTTLLVGASAGGCAPPVPLLLENVARLRDAPEVAVGYRASPTPWVECWALTREDDVGCQVEDQITARLRAAVPVDPARATAEHFLALVSAVRTGLHFRDLAPGHALDRARDLRSAPVLEFRTVVSSLVGSGYAYQPALVVRATLLDRPAGRVLWRDTCDHPRPLAGHAASPAELGANGGALYARLILAEAQRCADDLVYAFRPARQSSTGSSRGAVPELSRRVKDGLRIGP